MADSMCDEVEISLVEVLLHEFGEYPFRGVLGTGPPLFVTVRSSASQGHAMIHAAEKTNKSAEAFVACLLLQFCKTLESYEPRSIGSA